jgi:predicted acyltransferase
MAATQSPETQAAPAAATSQRLMSVDALRGFDMFWIIGADALVGALHRMTPNRPTALLADQLEHADWAGFHFYDLIFPLFVFLMGVSVVFSLTKTIEREGRGTALKRVFRRGILLFLVGLFYSGGFSSSWPDMRLMGVLNRIALAYMFGGLLFCFLKPRALVAVCVSILLGYWALMALVPIRDIQLDKKNLAQLAEKAGDPDTAALFRHGGNPSAIKDSPAWAAAQRMFYATTNYVTGKYGPGYNLSDHIDFQYLPGRKYDTFFDPEGFVSTLPAVATCLLGIFAGLLLKSQTVPDQRKVLLLLSFGCASAILGWVWNLQFPVIKKIWTSSYVLVAGGYSAMLLGAFYQIVDIWRVRGWCQPFVWMGMNSITIYLANNILGYDFGHDYYGFRKIAPRFLGGDVKAFLDAHVTQGFGELVVSLAGLLLAFWFVRFLYHRKIFLRL